MAENKLVQMDDLACPICMMDEEHADLNQSLFFRRRSEKDLLEILKEKGYHYTLEELRRHRKHIRACQPRDELWANERRLLKLDDDKLKELPTMESLEIVDSKVKSIRASLNSLEERGLRDSPEYNVALRRLIDLIELKEKIEGKIGDTHVTINLSELRDNLEKKRKGEVQ